MRIRNLALLTCLLAVAGCLTVTDPVADSDAGLTDSAQPNAGGRAIGADAEGGSGGGFAGNSGFEGNAGAAGGFEGEAGSFGGAAGDFDGTAGGFAGAAGGFAGAAGGFAGAAGGFDGVGGAAAPDGSVSVGPDAGSGGGTPLLGTQSAGCERIDGTDLCIGEGWMLAPGEALPDCNESGAYRVCSFTSDVCESHTVMMVQRCE